MLPHDTIKLDKIAKLIKENPKDVDFVRQHLNLKNRELLDELIKEHIKVKTPKVIDEKPKMKPLMVTVFDESRLTAEFSVALSKSYKQRSIAVLDGDRFGPKLNIYFNSKSYIKSVFTHLDYQRTTGLNLLIDASHKHSLTKQYAKHIALRVPGYRNIHYFSGSYVLDDYEYYKLEDYKKVLNFLRSTYDVVIVSVNDFIYDAFTCHSLMVSDCNLICSKGNISDIQEKLNYMDFLERKQKISKDKNIHVIFDYSYKMNADKKIIKQFIKERLMFIPYLKKRNIDSTTCYSATKHMRRSQLQVYMKLFKLIDRVSS